MLELLVGRGLRTRLVAFSAALGIVAAVGCNDGRPKRVTVSGTVLLDGEPLTKGSVIFVPEGGRPSNGKIGPDGRFVLRCFDDDDGALLGVHRVAVAAKEILSESNIKWYAPSRYADYRTSGLSVEITESVDDLVLSLTSKPDGSSDSQAGG